MLKLKQRIKHIKNRMVSRITYAIDPQLIYGKEAFYDDTRKGKIKSVRIAAALIKEYFQPQTVVDIGCGEGLFLNELHQQGIQVIGCDISEAALKVAPKDFLIFQADATKPIRFNKRFDLCICIEIAEHIPNRYSKTLVKNAVQASDTVFFTAAPPWQGGVGHINEQPFEFWHELFKAEGYQLDKHLTETLQNKMADEKVVFWLHKNLMIFTQKPANTDQ